MSVPLKKVLKRIPPKRRAAVKASAAHMIADEQNTGKAGRLSRCRSGAAGSLRCFPGIIEDLRHMIERILAGLSLVVALVAVCGIAVWVKVHG